MNSLLAFVALASCGVLWMAPGWCLLRLFGYYENLNVSWGLMSLFAGYLPFSLILFLAGAAGMPYHRYTLLGLVVAVTGVLFVFSRRKARPQALLVLRSGFRQTYCPGWLNWLLGGLVLVALTLTFLYSTAAAIIDVPGMTIWALKAKVFFVDGRLSVDYFTGRSFEFTHTNYPLAFPLLILSYFKFLGQWDDYAIKAIPSVLGMATVLLLLSFSRARGSLLNGYLVLLLLFVTAKTYTLVSISLYAESLLAPTLVLGSIFAFQWLEEGGDHPHTYGLVPTGTFLGMLGWIKLEGTILACIFLSALCFHLLWRTLRAKSPRPFRQMLVSGACLWAPFVLFTVPWFWFCWKHNILSSQDFSSATGASWNFENCRLAVQVFGRTLFLRFGDLSLIWITFVAVALIRFNDPLCRKIFCYALGVCVTFLAIMILSFGFSIRPIQWHLEAAERLVYTTTLPTLTALAILLAPGTKRLN